MKLKKCFQALAAAAVMVTGSAHALSKLGIDPPASLIIGAGGFEWVYAAPCAGELPSCGVVLLHHGWTFANDAQWNASFANISALITAFSPGGVTKCAAPYFSTLHDHCDINDAQNGYIWHSPLAPDAAHRDNSAAETFLIRRNGNVVPEPASLVLLGIGLAGLGAMRRRKTV